MYGKVEICGVNTSKLKVLNESEKRLLLQKTKKGDKQAREELINGNLRLVLSVIQSFKNRNENLDDLFQVGCIGLIKAIDNFNPELDLKFSTYAVPMIIGELRRYLRDYNTIRVPRSLRDLAYRALKAKEALSAKNSNEPTIEEISKEINEDPKSVSHALDAILEPISLYDPIYSDNGDSIYVLDQISDTSSNDEIWLNNIAIENAIKCLDTREQKILLMRFYNGKTQTEISEEIGISQAQVSRLEKCALDKIRKLIS
jgi:RNA polymerase sporulation-specific sigma factor